jgi:hypothetical protein
MSRVIDATNERSQNRQRRSSLRDGAKVSPTSRRPAKRNRRDLVVYVCACGGEFESDRIVNCPWSSDLPDVEHVVTPKAAPST